MVDAAPLRVLLVADFAFPGTTGSPLHCMSVAQGLRAQGCEVRVLRYAGLRGEARASEWNGFGIREVPARSWLPTLRGMLRGQTDVLYLHGQRSALITAPMRVRRRSVVELHALTTPSGWRSRVISAASRWASKMLRDKVIVLSERERQDAMQARLAPGSRLVVAYPPVEAAEHPAAARGPRSESPVVLYAGNFHAYQGLDLLMTAMAIVWQQRPDVRIRIVGGSADELARAVGELPAGGLVEVVGHVPAADMPLHYEDADILVIPRPDVPINRTTPRKLGEYLASGRLVVATDVADTGALLREHHAGLVSPPDADSFGVALLAAVAADRDHTHEIEAARQLAARSFGVQAACATRLGLLRLAAGR